MLFIDNKYTRIYFSIIEKSKTSVKTGKPEIHHIIPRCLGGTNEPTNLVSLSLREHFVCHRLLVKMVNSTVDRAKLAYACWQMTKRHTVNSRIRNSFIPRFFPLQTFTNVFFVCLCEGNT